MTYEEACAAHSWQVPERYNIAADVCDKHPRDKLAMIHEDPEGNVREVDWGQLQAMSDRFARLLAQRGVQRGDRVAMLLPATPETAAAFFGTWKSGAIPAAQAHSPMPWKRSPSCTSWQYSNSSWART